jgi:hypothetical protein
MFAPGDDLRHSKGPDHDPRAASQGACRQAARLTPVRVDTDTCVQPLHAVAPRSRDRLRETFRAAPSRGHRRGRRRP